MIEKYPFFKSKMAVLKIKNHQLWANYQYFFKNLRRKLILQVETHFYRNFDSIYIQYLQDMPL